MVWVFMMVYTLLWGNIWVYGKFSCLREALSFMDGGNAPFIESLYLIDNLNQMNAGNESCILRVLQFP